MQEKQLFFSQAPALIPLYKKKSFLYFITAVA